MTLSRRSFLIGLGATTAVLSAPWPGFTDTSKLFLGRNFFDQVNLDEVFMSMRGTDFSTNSFINYSIYRQREDHEDLIFRWAMHPQATMRWVAAPEASVVITKELPVRLDIDPCGLHSLIGIRYAIRRKKEKRTWREEQFIPGEWIDDEWVEAEHIRARWMISRFAHFSETFDVRDGNILAHEIHALDPEDEHMIK